VDAGDALSQACELTVTLRDGSTRTSRREDADGREAKYYASYMSEKFNDCVEQVFDRQHAEDLLPRLMAFDRCENVGSVMRLLAKPVAGL